MDPAEAPSVGGRGPAGGSLAAQFSACLCPVRRSQQRPLLPLASSLSAAERPSSPVSFFHGCCGRRSCHPVPLPRHVADVRRLLDILFYEQLLFIAVSACLVTAHLGILVYTCTFEKPLQEDAPFLPILAVMLALSLATLACRVRFILSVRALQNAWWHRSVLKDTIRILTSPLCQTRRLLFVVSFCVYFATLHMSYYHGGTANASVTQAPVLLRYVSILVLAFLSLLGPHILLLACVCTTFFMCLCSPPEHFEQMLVEEPRGGRALPKKILQRMKEEKWVPSSAYWPSAASAVTCEPAERTDTGLDDEPADGAGLEGHADPKSAGKTRGGTIKKRRLLPKRFTRKQKGSRPVAAVAGGRDRTSGVDDANICAICLCEFQENDLIRRLPCQHFFHSACIARWLRSHASCPLRCHVNFFTGTVYSAPLSDDEATSRRAERPRRDSGFRRALPSGRAQAARSPQEEEGSRRRRRRRRSRGALAPALAAAARDVEERDSQGGLPPTQAEVRGASCAEEDGREGGAREAEGEAGQTAKTAPAAGELASDDAAGELASDDAAGAAPSAGCGTSPAPRLYRV
ncbi:zinc finger, C3HC4 type (RING finger) domain-containing protein [Besnoitia besnoiti]|uniref:Zinc finger, C3HC4 type (RING finger) domain-containing protein n=1 Tax=Besnoitia besnoiti TaxID=94643 RepID=A0A2A9MKS0_BESBE|nr:zinc finger, C3HC4 type (RING finger) domain-containing protein [Besnoitia besnoiti]PFH38595.1 zinc finger, C3HC4 type (RING finger) domain-containing protein [Besnoitia besnoiti]